MYTIDEKGNTYHLIKCEAGHNGSAARHKKECRAFCRYSIETYGYVSHWVFGTDFIGVEGLQRLKLCVNKLQRALNKLGVAYIMVFEEGETGRRWHVHTLIDRYMNIEVVRNIWIKATGLDGAHINVTCLEPDPETRLSNTRLASYITKSCVAQLSSYVTKSISRYPGERLFRKSNSVSTLIRPFLNDYSGREENAKPVGFVGIPCVSIDPWKDAVKVIAQMSGYDEAEVIRRLLSDD